MILNEWIESFNSIVVWGYAQRSELFITNYCV